MSPDTLEPPEPGPEEARLSLTDHVIAKGCEIFAKYGPQIGWRELQSILADRDCVRYPCELVFDDRCLEPDELAFPAPKGERPEDGFTLYVHPYFSLDTARVPLIALYQLVLVNYGSFAAPRDAEFFAAAALGVDREEYYSALCSMADEISSSHLLDEAAGPDQEQAECSSGGSCSCGGTGESCHSS